METSPDLPAKSCGSCTLCCKVMGIVELEKPGGTWCGHCKPGRGCAIYESRPKSCGEFNCLWLAEPSIPENLKPERTKVVLVVDSDGKRLIANCDPSNPLAWRREPLYGQLKRWAVEAAPKGEVVVAMAGRRMWVVTTGEDIDVGELDPLTPFVVHTGEDGKATVKLLPPLKLGEVFDPATAAGQVGLKSVVN